MVYNKSEKHLTNLSKARDIAAAMKVTCPHCSKQFSKCGIKNHKKYCATIKECPVCQNSFRGKSTTCSHSCANTYFRSGEDHPNWGSCRSICFSNHGKICVICGEDKIVETHHLDENPQNNEPCNLIPLCPTHHQYWHSKYKCEVEEKIYEYLKKWKQNRVEEAESSQSLGRIEAEFDSRDPDQIPPPLGRVGPSKPKQMSSILIGGSTFEGTENMKVIKKERVRSKKYFGDCWLITYEDSDGEVRTKEDYTGFDVLYYHGLK